MALFDERNLKTFLDNMTEDERESFVNGFFEIIEVPDSLKKEIETLQLLLQTWEQQ